MWGAAGGWWCGALAAAALLLLVLAQRCRRRKRPRPLVAAHTVHIVRDVFPARLPQLPRVTHPSLPFPVTPIPARRTLATLAGAPADDPQHPPPQIVIVQNSTQNTIAQNQNPEPSSSTAPPEFKGIPKLPLPEQWIHKRSLDCKYTATIPRPLAQIVNADLGSDLNQETRAKKFSATRSPSLEKDEKSPFVSSAKSDRVFGFDSEIVNKLNESEMNEKMMSKDGERSQDASPSNLRRFRSVSTRLNMCSVNDNVEGREHQERLEMQNSPRIVECSSAKEKSSAPKFDFSPKILGDTITSPRFFTPPETVSPMFFAEPSPKSVYYDSVRSPKFFPDTPRDVDVPNSPRTLGDHLNRNGLEKPSSPKILSARPSPKVHSYNKENYFTFDQSCSYREDARMSPRPRKYGGRNSIERERFTPPADKEIRKYRRHNSCDTNYKTVEVSITDDNKQELKVLDKDVVDSCVKMESLQIDAKIDEKPNELTPSPSNSAQARRQRLKSISLDSDNAKIIEQNLGLPIAKQMKDQMNEAYKNQEVSASCESMERHPKTPSKERPVFKFEDNKERDPDEAKSPVKQKKCLRQSSDTQSFLDMPRFSPKEFEITVTSEEGATTSADFQTKPKTKNLRNLTIDLTKRDSELEKELLEFEKLYTDAEEKKVKTPTLKVKATSLDSSESVNLSLPQKKTLEVPQNSISVPNTPKRQLKRILAQKSLKHDPCGAKLGYNSIQSNAEQRRFFMKAQDSGIYLRENHANLMLYQPGTSRMGSRTMGSFDENMTDFNENPPEINISGSDNRYLDSGQTLGSNLLNYKQNLSVSSTNLKTLPEGVPSDDFEPSVEDEKVIKKLYRRNSNQSLMLSTHSLQGSNCSLNSSGASCHNLATVRTSLSNFSLNSDRQKKLSLERRDSNASLTTTDHMQPTNRVVCSSNNSLSGDVPKNCLLQRRGSNNSFTLNIYSSNNLSRHSSNSSLNKDGKQGPKKGLLERRSSNTSLTLNINTSNPQLSVNRGLSISNYNLNGSTCNLSRYNSNHSIDNATAEPRKGILERRSSNTSLTLNIQPQEPRDLEIDETLLEPNLKDLPHREKHRKSLSTENLIPKSYKHRARRSTEKGVGFGSHDNLWSTSYTEAEYPQNLTYVCGDQDNEIIYAFGRQDDPNFQQGFVRNITTKPLSPQSTSEDFRLYLANMQHLQNASSVLSRKQLRDLNEVFQNGYSKVKCHNTTEGQHCCSGRVEDLSKENPQMVIPEISQPCSEYQKMLLRNLHQEFWDMPTNFQEKPIVSGSHPKNRYKTILPNEHSRFILRNDAGVNEGYINANFIKGHEYTKNTYIATQGPLQNTIYDFWLMVHQNTIDYKSKRPPDPGPVPPNYGVQKIVMLTNFIENNRQKCEKYFPLEINEEVEFRNPETDDENRFVIKNCGMIKKCGYTIRKLDVRYYKSVSDMCASDSGQPEREFEEIISDSGKVYSDSGKIYSDSGNIDSDSGESVRRPSLVRDASIDIADRGDPKTDFDQSASVSHNIFSQRTVSTTVYHYWFHNWADHKCPKDVNALLTLSLDVLKNSLYDFENVNDVSDALCKCGSPKSESKFLFPPLEGVVPCDVKCEVSTPLDLSVDTLSPPTIVHCSAGIGRTGCLIAILNGIKQLTNEQKVDVLGIVCNMRLNRGGMVQNSEQYELIHKVLCLYEQACLPL